jgi:hypothetical protein
VKWEKEMSDEDLNGERQSDWGQIVRIEWGESEMTNLQFCNVVCAEIALCAGFVCCPLQFAQIGPAHVAISATATHNCTIQLSFLPHISAHIIIIALANLLPTHPHPTTLIIFLPHFTPLITTSTLITHQQLASQQHGSY